ncbi:MAG: hypothetical protein R2713_06525 [Ilumatobacteraceae bacterium]
MLDQYEVYGLVAGIAAARAAERLTPDEITDLRKAHDQFVKAKGGCRAAAFEQARSSTGSSTAPPAHAGCWRARPAGTQHASHHYMFDSAWAALAAHHHEQVLSRDRTPRRTDRCTRR